MAGTLNGITVLEASIHLPRIGVWWADIVLDGDVSLAGTATLSYPGWSEDVVGAVADGGETKHGRIPLRMVGGAGKLAEDLPAKAYQGAPVLLPVRDVLEEAGEELSSSVTSGLDLVLNHWVRTARPAHQCLGMLARKAGFAWRFLPDGTFWFGDENWPEASITYDLMDEQPEQDAVLIATDDLLLPGTTFRSRHVERVCVSPHESRTKVWFG